MRATMVVLMLSGCLAACASQDAATMSSARFSPRQCADLASLGHGGEPTRARLRSEVAALTAVGYDPLADADTYPESFQAAQQRVNHQYRLDCRM
jgi:Flp pilus assembly protein TadD